MRTSLRLALLLTVALAACNPMTGQDDLNGHVSNDSASELGAQPPAALYDEATPTTPTALITLSEGHTPQSVALQLNEAATSPVELFEATLVTVDADIPVIVASIDPHTHRPMTLPITAQATGLWEQLQDGAIVTTAKFAETHSLQLAEKYALDGPHATAYATLGATAHLGDTIEADVFISNTLAEQIKGTSTPTHLLVSTDNLQQLDRLEGLDVLKLTPPRQPNAQPLELEPLTYTELPGGRIRIDPEWVSRWIVTINVPHLGNVTIHRHAATPLHAALSQIVTEDLHDHIDRRQFAGTWVPRHIDWDRTKPLSMHAWGLAIDINSVDNCLGCQPTMHPRIVEIFESWGFNWGGRWSRPDGMHFELARHVTRQK